MLSFFAEHDLAPRILISDYSSEENVDYLITEEALGESALLDKFVEDGVELAKIVATAIKFIHSLPTENCPFDLSFDYLLSVAKKNLEISNYIIDDWQYSDIFDNSPEKCLQYLFLNKPTGYKPVVNHGDLCVPNYFIKNNKIVSLIDCGNGGVGCEWIDIAIALKSLKRNVPSDQFEDTKKKFFETLEIEPNEFMIDYILYLDEFF